MQTLFTQEEINNFNFYNSGIAFFDDTYEIDNEQNQKLNKKAAKTNFELLKYSKSCKVALFKEKDRIFFTSLQGCSCKNFENSEDNCCVHMFKLAQLLGIIDSETGVLLNPQEEFEEIYFDNKIDESISTTKKINPSTIGIGKHCQNCNKIIGFEETVCPSCGLNPDKREFSNNYSEYIKIVSILFFIFVLVVIIRSFF